MAQLLLDGLDDTVRDRLHALADQHGRSLEDEARDILSRAVAAAAPQLESPTLTGGLGTQIARRFAECGLDFEIPEIRGQIYPQIPDFT